MSSKTMSPQQFEQMLAAHSTETPPKQEFELWQRVGQHKVVGFYFVRTAIAWEESVEPGWYYILEHQEELQGHEFVNALELKNMALESSIQLVEEGDRCLVKS